MNRDSPIYILDLLHLCLEQGRVFSGILNIDLQSHTLILPAQQRNEITESKKEIEKGLFIEQADLDNEFNKWISTK